MRLRNFLDFESEGLTRYERLSLILHAVYRARERVRSETERLELEYVYQDCQDALSSLHAMSTSDERWLDRRMDRMARVLKYYEGGFVRLNRRYWWALFAVGLALLLLAILYGSPPDSSTIEASYSLL